MENSGFGRLISVFTSPGRTFASIAAKPTIAAPLLALILAGLLSSVVITPRMDMAGMVQEGIERSGREMPPEQVEKITGFYEKFKWPLALGGSLIGQPVFWLIATLLFWVILKLCGSDLEFLQAWSVALHAALPQSLLALLSIPVALTHSTIGYDEVKSGSFLKSNPAAFLPKGASPVVTSLLSNIDVFTIWTIILLAIGYGIVARTKRGTTWMAVSAVWLFWILVKAVPAAMQGMAAK